jgi:hypothetical protein
MLELEARQSHLYAGARGRILSGCPQDGPVSVTFGDLSRAAGRLDGDCLVLGPYRTAAGRAIPQRRWRVAFDAGGFRILGRLP